MKIDDYSSGSELNAVLSCIIFSEYDRNCRCCVCEDIRLIEKMNRLVDRTHAYNRVFYTRMRIVKKVNNIYGGDQYLSYLSYFKDILNCAPKYGTYLK